MSIKGFFWSVKDFIQATNRKPINILAGQDGRLYEIRDHLIGRLITQTNFVHELDPIQPGFEFKLNKIPGELLQITLSFFRAYCNEWNQNEVMTVIYYDKLTKDYLIDCPFQKVSKSRIMATMDPTLSRNSRYVQVMHIHSHNTMRAIFSGIDNRDEQAYGLYAVVGRLDFIEPEMLLRVGCNGQYIQLPLRLIFDKPILSPTSMKYPIEWDQRVQVIE